MTELGNKSLFLNLGHSETTAMLQNGWLRTLWQTASWYVVSILFTSHSCYFLRLIYEANTVVVSFDCHNMVVGELGVHPHSIVSHSAEWKPFDVQEPTELLSFGFSLLSWNGCESDIWVSCLQSVIFFWHSSLWAYRRSPMGKCCGAVGCSGIRSS